MSPVYWSTGGNFLAAPENKHINIMNIRGKNTQDLIRMGLKRVVRCLIIQISFNNFKMFVT